MGHHDHSAAAQVCPPEALMSSPEESSDGGAMCSLPGPNESEDQESNPLLQSLTFMNTASEPARGAHEASEVGEALHEHHEHVESGAGLFSAAPPPSMLYGPDGVPLAGRASSAPGLVAADGSPLSSSASASTVARPPLLGADGAPIGGGPLTCEAPSPLYTSSAPLTPSSGPLVQADGVTPLFESEVAAPRPTGLVQADGTTPLLESEAVASEAPVLLDATGTPIASAAPTSELGVGVAMNGLNVVGGALTFHEGSELVNEGGTTNTVDGRLMQTSGTMSMVGGGVGLMSSAGLLGTGTLATGAAAAAPVLGAGAAIIGTEAAGDQFGAHQGWFGQNEEGENRGAFEAGWDIAREDGNYVTEHTGSPLLGGAARATETVVNETGAVCINAPLGVAAIGDAALEAPGHLLMSMQEGQRQQDLERLRAGSSTGELPPPGSWISGEGPTGNPEVDMWNEMP